MNRTQCEVASETTKAANAAMLKALPFDDQSTFEDARRGFIAPLPNTRSHCALQWR
jgi:alkyl sulfatase BDS1-like metallo-beta-lactamase superfamily hydrolase